MKTMKKVIGADSAILAGLQIDMLQKVRSGQITLDQLERFNNLSLTDREKLFNKGRGNMSVLNTALARLKEAGYLDTSFEGRETHPLIIRALTKEQALGEYKNSGGTYDWYEFEKKMSYSTPKAEALDVMILNFNKGIANDEALAKMGKLGVRPLTNAELIQYGIAYPSHQKKKLLVGLGTKYIFHSNPHSPLLWFNGIERMLSAERCGTGWGAGSRFPVVLK